MARASYLAKKDGRYWFQKRFVGFVAGAPTHLRVSLRTNVYRDAVARMVSTMWTVEKYEISPDLATRGRYLLGQLDSFNVAGVPQTVDATVSRRTVEVLVNRFLVEAQAVRHPIVTDQPEFWPAWMKFCDDCTDGEAIARTAERRAYELGRVHAEEAADQGWSRTPIIRATRETRHDQHRQTVALLQARSTPTSIEPLRREDGVSPDQPPASMALVASATSSRHDTGTDDQLSADSKLSRVLAEYLSFRRIADGDGRAQEDVGLIVAFAIALLGDRPLSSYTTADFKRLEEAMPVIPDRTGIPKAHTISLHKRYLYAQKHGSKTFKAISRKRLRNGWHRSLHVFLDWTREKNLATGPRYTFTLVGKQNLGEQERDAWRPDEILRLFSLPLFTGCLSQERFWTPGKYFVQNDVYWGYILIFFTGMRPSEIGKLLVADLVQIEDIWYLDLRRDKSKPVGGDGQRRFKSSSAYRLIPLPQLIIDLGILERKADLEAAREKRLFPEWTVYTHPTSGREMWGHHFSKSWQYIKVRLSFARAALTLYGGRHTRAGWYDAAGIPQRVRNRLLGHAPSSVAEGYGPIDLTTDEARLALASTNDVESAVAELLITAKLRAAYGELQPLRTWAKATRRAK